MKRAVALLTLATLIGVTIAVERIKTVPPNRTQSLSSQVSESRGAGGGSLYRSQAVIDEKIESKSRRIANGGKKAQHPGGLMLERVRQRAGEDGQLAMGALLRAKDQVDAMRDRQLNVGSQSHQRDAGVWSWESLGPGNIGGRVRAILTHPSDPDLLLLGSASGGIWKSTNGGDWWNPVDDFMANLAITCLVRDPNDPSVVYASTGEGFGNFDAVPGAGIFRSDDGGSTWYNLPASNNNNFRWVNRLAVDATQSGVVYAATVRGTGTGHIYKTTDGGVSWSNVKDTFGRAYDVKTHSTISDRILVGSGGGVYLSTNGGFSWSTETAVGSQLPVTDAANGRFEVAFAGNATHMYVSMEGVSGEVWQSTDAGTTWKRGDATTGYLGGQGWYDNAIWVDPTNADRILVGGIDLYRSVDGGETLTKVSDWRDYHNPGNSAHADQHTIVPATNFATSEFFYVGNDGGIQRAKDPWTIGQNDWENLANGLGITQFYGGAASPNGSVIVGGTQDNDQLRYRSSDPTGEWYQAETGDGGFAAVDFVNPFVIYSEYVQLQIQKSANGGNTYFDATNGLGDAGSSALFIAPFKMDPNSSNVLVAGGASIWRTTDAAGTWNSIRGPQGSLLCSAMEISKSSSHYWIGYDSGRVSKSTDAGVSWADLDGNGAGLPNRWITDIAVNPTNDNEIFVSLSEYQSDPVWYSSDGGSTWENRSGLTPNALPSIPANTVVFHPLDPNWVYVGTDLGVFASEDQGLNWSVTAASGENEGPANVEVTDLFFYGDQHLVAATHGRGMYRCRPLETAYVDLGVPGGGDGSESDPFPSVTMSETMRGPGTNVSIESGIYDEGPLTLTKRGALVGTGGVVTLR